MKRNKFGLDRNDFESLEAFRKEYKRLHAQTDAHIEYQKEYYQSGAYKKSKEKYRKSSKGKDSISKYNSSDKRKLSNKKYRQTEHGRCIGRFFESKRRAAKLQRTPIWADLEAIKEVYKNCPVGHEIDHIIPLRGNNVSGLHVFENLQYLTQTENRKKANKYEGLSS